MALSYKEGGKPQFRPPPRLPGPPIPPVENPMAKLKELTIKLAIKKAQILAGIEKKKQELIAKAKQAIQDAIRSAMGILKTKAEEKIPPLKRKIAKIKAKIEKIKEKKEKIEAKIQKLKDLYEKYKNLDEILYAEAMRLLQIEIDKLTEKLQKEIDAMKAKAKEKLKAEKEKLIAKLEIEKKKEKIEAQKKKIENIKKEYEDIKKRIEEIQELIARIQYLIEHAEEEAMKYVVEKTKPILEKKKKQLEEKIEPKKKKLEEKMAKVKKKIADIAAGIPDPKGALKYQMFSAGVTIYWVGAIINPGPGAPNGIMVLSPGTPIMTFNPLFDFKTQGTDPAEPIRQLIPMIKAHLATITGLWLMPTGTPPFSPIPWAGYGATIEWESLFVQPVAMGLKNGQDSLGNLLADNYDRAIKTGFPNAPSIPIPFTSGVAQKIKSMTMVADLDAIKDILIAMAYQIPIKPIERAVKLVKKKQEELEEKIVKPILKEKEKIEAHIEKLKEYQKKIEEYMKLIQEYADWAAEQQAAIAYYSDPANIVADATAAGMDAASDLANSAGDLGSVPS